MNDLEHIVLNALLDGPDPQLEQLRGQLEHTTVRDREITESGQFTDFWVGDEAKPLEVDHRFAIDDLYGTVTGVSGDVAFLLHIVRGRLKLLEAFAPGETWPATPQLERTWHVAPEPAEARQLVRVDTRDLDFALRGLDPWIEEDDA